MFYFLGEFQHEEVIVRLAEEEHSLFCLSLFITLTNLIQHFNSLMSKYTSEILLIEIDVYLVNIVYRDVGSEVHNGARRCGQKKPLSFPSLLSHSLSVCPGPNICGPPTAIYLAGVVISYLFPLWLNKLQIPSRLATINIYLPYSSLAYVPIFSCLHSNLITQR